MGKIRFGALVDDIQFFIGNVKITENNIRPVKRMVTHYGAGLTLCRPCCTILRDVKETKETQIIISNGGRGMRGLEQKYIDSREVAEMVGKEHSKLLRDIRVYSEQLGQSKIGQSKINLSEFWVEDTYENTQNKTQPCYLVTKKGCEFIAHKLTGKRGTEFTALYINRFHDMEDYIRNEPKTENSKLEQSAFMVKFIADDMRVNDASRLLMYEGLCKDFNIPTWFLPKYEHNGNREMKAVTHLLKENGYEISAIKFNSLLLQNGILEERERPSSNGTKKYKALTEKGLN